MGSVFGLLVDLLEELVQVLLLILQEINLLLSLLRQCLLLSALRVGPGLRFCRGQSFGLLGGERFLARLLLSLFLFRCLRRGDPST